MDKETLKITNDIAMNIRAIESSIDNVEKATKIAFKDAYGEFFHPPHYELSKGCIDTIKTIILSELNLTLIEKQKEFESI